MPLSFRYAVSNPASATLQAPQSVLEAGGEAALRIAQVSWVLFIGGALIFVAVIVLVYAALRAPEPMRAALARRPFVVGAGIVFPVLALTVLLVYTFIVAAGLVRAQAQPAAARIQVTGEMWWWRVRYLDATGASFVETANEIRIPAGEPVDLELAAADVIHSFWVPALAGKLDMLPGKVNRLRVRAEAPGIFRGQCAEFCGAQHAKMALLVVALAPAEYEAWLRAQREPAAEPGQAAARRGRELFAQARCSVCHAIRGTDAAGTLGPDLTHLGGRLTLAAATLPNRRETLARWISDAQHVKPGSLMPAYRGFSDEELAALVSYLEGLR